jgi:hypothetical protein
MVLFGFGMKSIIITTTLFAIWIILLNSRAGVKQINRSPVEMAHGFGALPMDAYLKIYFRAALPKILGGVRIGNIRAVKGGDHWPVADLHRRLRRAVRSLFLELPDGALLGGSVLSVRTRLHNPGVSRLSRTPGGVLRGETLIHWVVVARWGVATQTNRGA